MINKNWQVLGQLDDIEGLSSEEINQKIVETILQNRQIDDVDFFLNPSSVDNDFLDKLKNLFGSEIEKAIEVITEAISNDHSIVIHGDYDVDGVCATAILWETIYYDLDYKKVMPFIPHRVDHGYGLSKESIDEIARDLADKNKSPGLLITVDCGITAKSAVEYARERGFKIIITDHHTKPEDSDQLPQVSTILHTYELCGAGIAWVLARNLNIRCSKTNIGCLENGLDLVALATLADIQPLTGSNRSLVKEGLVQLTNTQRAGLQALYHLAGITRKTIGPYEVGWIIGPRLNATGRLEHALDALRLLVVRNQKQAFDITRRLNQLNYQRQQMTRQAVQQAQEMVGNVWSGDGPIMVSHQDWHEGIIGLIAAKLVEQFKVPAIAVSENGQIAKGSARSINGVNILELLQEFEEIMESVGGHGMAAGFSLPVESLESLSQKLASTNLKERFDLSASQVIKVDLELDPKLLTLDLYHLLEQLAPFGVGNSRPVFLTRGVKVMDKRLVGKTGDHLKLQLEDGISSIGFQLGHLESQVQVGKTIDVVFNLDKNDYWGEATTQLKIKDLSVNDNNKSV